MKYEDDKATTNDIKIMFLIFQTLLFYFAARFFLSFNLLKTFYNFPR